MEKMSLEDKCLKIFLSKKSSEKFLELNEEIESLKDEMMNNNFCQNCCCDENADWIEKIKIEQIEMLERIDSLERNVYKLENEIEKLMKNKNGRSNSRGNI